MSHCKLYFKNYVLLGHKFFYYFNVVGWVVFNYGVGFRGHPLRQDGFVEVLVTCSSSPLTGLVFLSFVGSLFLYVSSCIFILLCQCKV